MLTAIISGKMTVLQEEYVEALNNQEIAKKELDEGIRQRDLMVADHQRLKQSADEVQNLMDEQEDLLGEFIAVMAL